MVGIAFYGLSSFWSQNVSLDPSSSFFDLSLWSLTSLASKNMQHTQNELSPGGRGNRIRGVKNGCPEKEARNRLEFQTKDHYFRAPHFCWVGSSYSPLLEFCWLCPPFWFYPLVFFLESWKGLQKLAAAGRDNSNDCVPLNKTKQSTNSEERRFKFNSLWNNVYNGLDIKGSRSWKGLPHGRILGTASIGISP